ncbi:mediator of RNA polymerase II transcription subunit 28-like [Sciurus carolinensis]|uniref:mediator of RNA polymerase II transcription subunit 28-like n=1 Tax=Sciurus carolinensis TaxID=30640 RepID=UPI001FB1C6D9|nr:mediator of RNA polymerase II transcription subunit 28-like [Sciurus carolinensis]
MFSGQLLRPPPPLPGLPGQASLLQAAPGMPRTSSSTLKRLQSSVQKPEQVIKEDGSELRNELQRKDSAGAEALDKTGAGGHQCAAQKASEVPQGSLAYLQQPSANIPAPLKQT